MRVWLQSGGAEVNETYDLYLRFNQDEELRQLEESRQQALRWFHKAADQGHANAQNNLGLCYARGAGVVQDKVEAVKWYRLAAEQGNALGQVKAFARN